MKVTKILLFCFYLLMTAKVLADKIKLACTHPQVCNIVQEAYINLKIKNVKIIPITIIGDPHEFTPDTSQIKKMYDANYLVGSPIEITPWIKTIIKKRKSAKKPSMILSMQDNKYSHFWLLPKTLCESKKRITQKLNNWFSKSHRIIPIECHAQRYHPKMIKLAKKLKDTLIIVTHDSINELLNAYDINNLYLKTSSHGSKVSAKNLKKTYDYNQQKKKIIWIFEDRIIIPKKYYKNLIKNSKTIEIDTLGTYYQKPSAILKELIEKLESA